jgi:hypothetical protein
MTLHFTGRQRTAAQLILNATPLGNSLATLNATLDDGKRLTIRDDDSVVGYLSSGEALLLGFLDNLSRGHLHRLLDRVDQDCQVAVIAAVAAACGFEAEATVTTEGGVTLRLVAPLGGAA